MAVLIKPRNHIRALATIAIALLAVSCSRSLPTAPDHAVGGRGDVAADPFAVVGLENQVVVTLAPGQNANAIAAQYGAIVVRNADGRSVSMRPVTGQAPGILMLQLGADARVQTSEPNIWLEPAEARQQSFAFDDGFGNEKTYAEQPAAVALGVGRAQGVATGQGVKVAILDTGVDPTHPDLIGHIIGGFDFVQGDSDPTDQKYYTVDKDRDGVYDEAWGHGTHVAGIVHLVAPEAQLLIVRVLDSEGRGDIVNVTAGVRWAVAHGAKVINLSLGKSMVEANSRDAVEALQNALEEADNAGVIVVSSAGNAGAVSPDFPSISSHSFGIGATDVDGNATSFSNHEQHLLLSAPGVGIRSAYPGNTYRLWSGTSMSTPWVTGTAALLAEKHPTWNMDAMAPRLENSATPIRSAFAPARDYGAGMLNIWQAMAPDYVANDSPAPEPIKRH